MGFTPFDFNEAIAQRREHAMEGLRFGSPVLGMSLEQGLVLVTVRRSQRKVYEIYDRLIYSAIGNQSDIEAVRLGAVDLAAREGFERSPDDVTAQRLVGFSLSPALKEVFRDQWRAPSVIRAVFGELGRSQAQDTFFILNYDGEFSQHQGTVALAGTPDVEARMRDWLSAALAKESSPTLEAGLAAALRAWALGTAALRDRHDDDDERPEAEQIAATLREELASARVEAGMLDRTTRRDAKFVMLDPAMLDRVRQAALSAEGD
jgi:proteasome alpha subunit